LRRLRLFDPPTVVVRYCWPTPANYSHAMPDMQDEAAERLDGVLEAAMGAAAETRS
jgi:hypothetical protein